MILSALGSPQASRSRRPSPRGFTIIELLMALLFMSFAFLPIFNLFRFGQEGAQSSKMEVEGTNYASDILNAFRTLSVAEIRTRLKPTDNVPYTDDAICNQLSTLFGINLPRVKSPFRRTVTLVQFAGQAGTFIGAIVEWIKQLQKVPCYLVIVDIDYDGDGVKRLNKRETFRLTTVVSRP